MQVLYGKDKKPVTVRVQTGATNGQMTEIVGCPETGGQCLRQGDMVALDMSDNGATVAGLGGDNVVFFSGPAGGGPPDGGGGVMINKSAP